MNSNRTSSFPAGTTTNSSLTRSQALCLMSFALAVGVMARISHWVYFEKSVGFGLFLMACTAGEALTGVLYYRAVKRGNQPKAGT